MRLFAHLHLGPRVYATFSNGIAYEYVAGQALNYALAVDKNVYPIIAQKIGQMHRTMSSYTEVLHPSQASTHVFHTLRNWLMMVPMRLADPANHYRMVSEMPTKATLVNELDELEVSFPISFSLALLCPRKKLFQFCESESLTQEEEKNSSDSQCLQISRKSLEFITQKFSGEMGLFP